VKWGKQLKNVLAEKFLKRIRYCAKLFVCEKPTHFSVTANRICHPQMDEGFGPEEVDFEQQTRLTRIISDLLKDYHGKLLWLSELPVTNLISCRWPTDPQRRYSKCR